MRSEVLNNMDIRLGLLHSIKVNCNYILYLWSEYNEYAEIEFKNESYEECFFKELNLRLINTLEKYLGNESLFFEIDELIQEYETYNHLKIIRCHVESDEESYSSSSLNQ